MPKVIIVEDEESHSKALVRLCSRYQQERGVELDTAVYDNPAVFLQKRQPERYFRIFFPLPPCKTRRFMVK